MSEQSPEILTTLRDAVAEVLGLLTGLDLTYIPEYDRFYVITRQLNRALRSNALEQEWSWYASTEQVGTVTPGERSIFLTNDIRPRMISDDAVRLVDDDDVVIRWAYFLPRDAIHKNQARNGLWCSVTRTELTFSRWFADQEEGLRIMMPVMREPTMFVLPTQPEDPGDPLIEVSDVILDQPVDFSYPDLIVLRAAFYYAQTDPVMQPRVQTLEAQYKDLMYQVMEREKRNTDMPDLNEWFVPIQSSIEGPDYHLHLHPHADERRL